MSSASVPHMFHICSAYVPHGIRRPCGHGPAQGEAQVVPVCVILAYSGPAHAEVEGRAGPPAMLAALHEFRTCSPHVPHMFRIFSAYVLHMFRMASAGHVAMAQPRVRPRSSQCALFLQIPALRAEVEGRACAPAIASSSA